MISTARANHLSVVSLTAALAIGLAMTVVLIIPSGEPGFGARGASLLFMDDFGGQGTNADRAAMPEIFLGRVVTRDGEANAAEPESDPLIVPAFKVDVETTLKGEAAGQIRLAVYMSEFTDELEGGPIEIGGRYLFAASEPGETDQTYFIVEGDGNIPIASDEEAAALIAEFELLIDEYPQRSGPSEPGEEIDPCDTLVANPTIDIDPNQGKPGRTVRVTARRLAAPEAGIWWRNLQNLAAIGTVRADCTMTEQITVPRDARPGRYDIIVIDARGLRVEERFHVVDD